MRYTVRSPKGRVYGTVDLDPLTASDLCIYNTLRMLGALNNTTFSALIIGADEICHSRTGEVLLTLERCV